MATAKPEDDIGKLEGLLDTELETETWHDRMKQILAGLVAKVHPKEPPIGSFISTLISFFWPSSAVDIWDLVKDQEDYMVDRKILEAEVDQLSGSLDGLHKTMERYVEAKTNEKAELMGAITASCNKLLSRLVNSNNAVSLIPLTVTLAYMHLASLKEQLMHGDEIYKGDRYQTTNYEVLRDILVMKIQTYKEHFWSIYAEWKDWKRDNLVVKMGEYKSPTPSPPFFFLVYTAQVKDQVSGETRRFEGTKTTTDSYLSFFKEICDAVKSMLWNKANGAMLQTLLPTFFLYNFIPGCEADFSYPHSSMRKAAFGPFSYNILEGSNLRTRNVYYPAHDNPNNAAITQVNVREWDRIDSLQFKYNGNWGPCATNSQLGKLHEFEAKGRLIHNVIFSFNNGGMVDIEIIFSDGQSSGRLGNRRGWRVTRVEAGGIAGFGLKDVKMSTRFSGVGRHSGVTQIELFYEHFICRPSQIYETE